jgi:Zn-dependent protease with chaperone function
MIFPYYIRLIVLCFAAFYVAHAALWLAIRGLASTSLRIAQTMRPRMAARFLFAVRCAPVVVSSFLIAGFCIPSYVWWEPDIAGERVGWFCLIAAVLGTAVWVLSISRGGTSVVQTERYLRRWKRESEKAGAFAEPADMLVVHDCAAIMAVAGVRRPRLVVSERVMEVLSEEQRAVAIRHEAAHRSSRDNLKKLALLLMPDVFPFCRGLGQVERAWSRFTEWAADDEAVDGSQERALSLATALVRVAKLGVRPAPAFVLSSLIADGEDLALRVDRLLKEPAYADRPLQPLVAVARNTILVLACVVGTVLLWPESLNGVHRLLERLVN